MNAMDGDNHYHDHGANVVTSSSLRDFIRSPKLYHDRYVTKTLPQRQSEAMLFGSAVHTAVLQPEVFAEQYYGDPYNARSARSQRLALENAGKTRLTEKSYDLCLALAKAAWEYPQAKICCSSGAVETPVQATMRNGLTVKCKPDLINGGGIYDLKTLGKPMCFFRDHAFALGYHIQAGFYTGVLIGAKDPAHRDFTFWVVTKQPPFEVQFFTIPYGECLAIWRSVCLPALNDLANCLRTNGWEESPSSTIAIPAAQKKYHRKY
jgi:hypothetical protein